MSVELVSVNNHLVARDHINTWRWFDAFGPHAIKWELNPVNSPVVSTTTAAGYDVDVYTAGTMVAGDSVSGGALTLVTSGTENQGLQIMAGEGFKFAAKWPTYFGCEFMNNDVSELDWIIGLTINDEELIGGATDGLYFRVADGSGVMSLVLEKDSAETTAEVATLADSTYVTAEWFYDGTNVSCYINGTLAATVAASNANMPNDEDLAAALALATGATAASTITLKWARCIQIQED